MNETDLKYYIEKYHGTVFRLAYSYVKKREDAEDIVQEAFLRLFLSDTDFGGDQNVKAWLIRIAINLSKDLLKSAWLKLRSDPPEDIPAETPEESVMISFIKRLKPEYAGVIMLFYYEGYSVKEIAEIRKISPTAVTSRLSRARKQLRKMLLEEGLYEENGE